MLNLGEAILQDQLHSSYFPLHSSIQKDLSGRLPALLSALTTVQEQKKSWHHHQKAKHSSKQIATVFISSQCKLEQFVLILGGFVERYFYFTTQICIMARGTCPPMTILMPYDKFVSRKQSRPADARSALQTLSVAVISLGVFIT